MQYIYLMLIIICVSPILWSIAFNWVKHNKYFFIFILFNFGVLIGYGIMSTIASKRFFEDDLGFAIYLVFPVFLLLHSILLIIIAWMIKRKQ